jgi:SAM-dependent methyltransferase
LTDDRFYRTLLLNQRFAGRLSRKAREGVYRSFLERMRPTAHDTVLDVGVSVDGEVVREESNILEQLYPYRQNITMLGIHEGKILEQRYPGAVYVRTVPGQPFPFADRQFDICHCNAVIEHVGREEDRRFFLNEVLRVGQRVFLTTPNRWYPVELHKMIPFLHWFPQDWYRALLRALGDEVLGSEENLNLLSRRQLDRLFREAGRPFEIIPYRFLGFASNFLVVVEP